MEGGRATNLNAKCFLIADYDTDDHRIETLENAIGLLSKEEVLDARIVGVTRKILDSSCANIPFFIIFTLVIRRGNPAILSISRT